MTETRAPKTQYVLLAVLLIRAKSYIECFTKAISSNQRKNWEAGAGGIPMP